MDSYPSAGQIRKFFDILDQKKVTSEGFQQRLNSGVLADFFDPNAVLDDRTAFRQALKLSNDEFVPFFIEVDYRLSLEQMIDAGDYVWVRKNFISDLIPIQGTGVATFEARYFNFGGEVGTEYVVEQIKQSDVNNPWMPAKIEHGLARAAACRSEQLKFPIIAVGSLLYVNDHNYVPHIGIDVKGHRCVDLLDNAALWTSRHHFLAVREVKPAS